ASGIPDAKTTADEPIVPPSPRLDPATRLLVDLPRRSVAHHVAADRPGNSNDRDRRQLPPPPPHLARARRRCAEEVAVLAKPCSPPARPRHSASAQHGGPGLDPLLSRENHAH